MVGQGFAGVTEVEQHGHCFGSFAVVEVGFPWVPALLGAAAAAFGLDVAEDAFAELSQAVLGAASGYRTAFRAGQRVLGELLDAQEADVFEPLAVWV